MILAYKLLNLIIESNKETLGDALIRPGGITTRNAILHVLTYVQFILFIHLFLILIYILILSLTL